MFSFSGGNKESTQKIEGTQKHLVIDFIKDDLIVLKDRSLHTVLQTSSISMQMRSPEEQAMIISSYKQSLNSLDFPIQILVRSRKVELDSYLSLLEDMARKQTVPLLKEQTEDYVFFLKSLLSNINIMDKNFYVVVPFYPSVITETSKGIFSFLGTGNKKASTEEASQDKRNYTLNRKQLIERTNIVANLLMNIGLRATQLPTKELVVLFSASYNPDTAGQQYLKSLSALGEGYVSAREKVKENLEE